LKNLIKNSIYIIKIIICSLFLLNPFSLLKAEDPVGTKRNINGIDNVVKIQITNSDLQNNIIMENNDLASAACRFLDIMLGPVGKAIYAFIIVMMGIGGYIGKLQPGSIVTVVLGGVLIFKGVQVIDIIIPNLGISSGCKCKNYIIHGKRNVDTYNYIELNLNEDCRKKI
jgi:type IV secretory pathway VirB2 component (pilin)